MDELLRRAGEDPWSLDLDDRLRLASDLSSAQEEWLPMLRELVEPPAPDHHFPAFLLATPAFDSLRQLLMAQRDAPQGTVPDTGTVDTVQRFVDHYRPYLEHAQDRSKVQV